MSHLFSNWSILDYVLVGIILASVIFSFFRGFFREAISLATWFFAFFAALKFSPAVSALFESAIKSPTPRYIVSAVLIFLIVLILGMLVNKLVHGLLTVSGLGLLDKLLGFIFGAARGILFATIILFILQVSPFQTSKWVKQSQLSPHFQILVSHFSALLPKEMRATTALIDAVVAPAQHVII